MTPDALVTFALVVFSIILHEIAHGYAALKFGDETALRMDRLTVNPVPHIDPLGTILIGTNLLRRHRLEIDFVARTVRLERVA